MTLDGAIATRQGESKWITSADARALGHRLRRRHDAILVGSGTVLADNPELTARDRAGQVSTQTPARFVLDSQARTPQDARILNPRVAPITLITSASAPADSLRALESRADIWIAPTRSDGRLDLLWVLERMGTSGIRSLMVEGGASVLTSFLFAGLGDHLTFFFAPMVLGQADARMGVEGAGIREVGEARRLHRVRAHPVGDDLLISGRLRPSPAAVTSDL